MLRHATARWVVWPDNLCNICTKMFASRGFQHFFISTIRHNWERCRLFACKAARQNNGYRVAFLRLLLSMPVTVTPSCASDRLRTAAKYREVATLTDFTHQQSTATTSFQNTSGPETTLTKNSAQKTSRHHHQRKQQMTSACCCLMRLWKAAIQRHCARQYVTLIRARSAADIPSRDL